MNVTGVAGAWNMLVEEGQYLTRAFSQDTWGRYLRRLGVCRENLVCSGRSVVLQRQRYADILEFVRQGKPLWCNLRFLPFSLFLREA